MVYWVNCDVRIISKLKLYELAELVSIECFGGIRFIPTDAYDEVPCVQLEKDILGFQVMLFGSGGCDGYDLALWPNKLDVSSDEISKTSISEYVACMLQRKLKIAATAMK